MQSTIFSDLTDVGCFFAISLGLPLSADSAYILLNHKNYNFLACDWFKNVLFSTNSLAQVVIGQFVIG